MKDGAVYFITGTDTGVGKTVVTTALAAALTERGVRCLPAKPVQTGCDDGADDLGWCLRMAGLVVGDEDHALVSLYRLGLAASPHLAAREAGVMIDPGRILSSIRQLASRWDDVLVEGAGGLLVPLNDEAYSMMDLMRDLDARPIVVTRNTLGTINHTALTLRELARGGFAPAAIVVNRLAPPAGEAERLIQADNEREIRRLAGETPVVALPFLGSLDAESLREAGRPLADVLAETR